MRTIKLIALILLPIIFFLSSCSEDNPVQTPTTGTIQGKVTNATGDTLVAGANITTSPPTSSVNSDPQGNYNIPEVPSGTYTVIATKGGYNPGSVNITVAAGKSTTGDIHLGIIAGNSPPSIPTLLSPANGATNQSTTVTLNWTCNDPDGDPLTYDVYFGKTNPPTTIVSSNQTATTLIRSGIDTSTTYYWKIVAKDNRGGFTPSNVWNFATMSGSQNIPLEFANWKCYIGSTQQYVSPATGVYEKVADGLKIYGSGYRGGAILHPTPLSQYPIANKTIYIKWKANGGGNFMGVWPSIFTDSVAWTTPYYPANLTTHHSYLNSYVITDDLWYYTRYILTSTSYTATTATGNYDNLGGTVVQTKTASLDHNYKYFFFGLWDTYAGTTPYAILGEARIE